MPIIERYLMREIVLSFLGVLLILTLVFFSGSLFRILAQIASGDFARDTLFTLLLLQGAENLVFTVPLSLYLGVLLALGRLWRDSEMAALAASGIGPQRIVRAVALLVALLLPLNLYFSLWLSPWAKQQFSVINEEARAYADTSSIIPGRFTSVPNSDDVVYVESRDANSGQLSRIFIHGRDEQGRFTIMAEAGQQWTDHTTGERYIELLNGHRHHIGEEGATYQIIRFDRYLARLGLPSFTPGTPRTIAMPTSELLGGGLSEMGELQWRLSIVIAAVLLPLTAVPLARTSPRQGRYAGLFIALVIYLVYSNLIGLGKSWVENDKISPYPGIGWIHLGMLLLTTLLILQHAGRLRLRAGNP